MWQQNYEPLGGSLGLSAAVASIPILVLFCMLGLLRRPAWMAALAALAAAFVLALTAYHMPFVLAFMSTITGAAYGVFPIAWIVFTSILLYRLAVETGKFEIIKDSIGGLTNDRRLQALFIAFSFGAFVEGAAGFGAPVAVSGALLVGLGFSPFYAAGICLLANTAPVAFGSIGIPVTTLAAVTELPVMPLSAMVGRLCAMISVFIPMYLLIVMVGFRKMMEVLPAVIICGVSFAAVQFYVSNHMGPELTDILSSLSCIGCMVLVLKFWKPKTIFRLEGDLPLAPAGMPYAPATSEGGNSHHATPALKQSTTQVLEYAAPTTKHSPMQILVAWMPYILLVAFVLVWGHQPIKLRIDQATHTMLSSVMTLDPVKGDPTSAKLNNFPVPGLNNQIERERPVTKDPAPYRAVYQLNILAASGTACLFATLATALIFRVSPRRFARVYSATLSQLAKSILTIAAMLGLAYLMNYSGMTSTLGLALARTGKSFPFFSAILGWLGVFLTGSDTSANALFGNLQVITANQIGINPVLTASVNSAAGVMGKMISLASIAVACAATGLGSKDEGKLFRFTVKHSILLAAIVGVVALIFAYVFPGGVPTK